MADYKVALFKTPIKDIQALTAVNALEVNIATRTGDVVASIVSVNTSNLDGMNLVTTVAYTV